MALDQSASIWRWLAAVCLAATAALHIAVVPEHLREAPYAGALFIGLSAAALAAALLLVRTRHALVWLGAVSLCLTALLGYVHLALGRAPFDV